MKSALVKVKAVPVGREVVAKADAKKLRGDIVVLKDKLEADYLTFGRMINRVLNSVGESGKSLYEEWGFDDFEEYCVRELGFHYRKGYSLSSIWEHVDSGMLPKARIEKIGWTKASTIAPLVKKGIIHDKKTADHWVGLAETLSYRELEEKVQQAKSKADGDAGIPQDEVFKFLAWLPKEQYLNWMAALDNAQKKCGSDKVPWLMDCIAMAFNAECFKDNSDFVRTLCMRIEENNKNLRVVVVDDVKKEVVYGEETVKGLGERHGKT